MGKEKEVPVLRSAESFPQRFEHEFERVFDDFFRRRWPRALSFDWPQLPGLSRENGAPRMDVVDGADAFTVRAELPGIAAKDVEVSVSDNTITIKGTCSHEETRQEGDYWQREIHEGASTRTLSLAHARRSPPAAADSVAVDVPCRQRRRITHTTASTCQKLKPKGGRTMRESPHLKCGRRGCTCHP